MRKTIKLIILVLLVAVLYPIGVLADDSVKTPPGYCAAEIKKGQCQAQKKVRKLWPGIFIVETCDGQPYKDVRAEWCTTASPNQSQPAAQPPTVLATPEILKPDNGQKLDLEGDYKFFIRLLEGVTYYSLELSQDGKVIYKNDEARAVSGTTPDGKNAQIIELTTKDAIHKNFHEGEVQVAIRAYINNQWSDARVITINLKSKKPAATVLTGTVSVDRVYMEIVGSSEEGTNFNKGDEVELCISSAIKGSVNSQVTFRYQVFNEKEQKQTFKNPYNKKDVNDWQENKLAELVLPHCEIISIPQEQAVGKYTFKGTVIYNGQESSKEIPFYVQTKPVVAPAQAVTLDNITVTNGNDSSILDTGGSAKFRIYWTNPQKIKRTFTGKFELFYSIPNSNQPEKRPAGKSSEISKESAEENDFIEWNIPAFSSDTLAGNYTVKGILAYKDGPEIPPKEVRFQIQETLPAAKERSGGKPSDKQIEAEQAKMKADLIKEVCTDQNTLSDEYKNKCMKAIAACADAGETVSAFKNTFPNAKRMRWEFCETEGRKQGRGGNVPVEQNTQVDIVKKQVCTQEQLEQRQGCEEAVAKCIDPTEKNKSIDTSDYLGKAKLESCKQAGIDAGRQTKDGAPGGGGKPQVLVETITKGYIHGFSEEESSFRLDSDKSWISVGSTTMKSDNASCVSGSVNLTLTKIADDKGNSINTNIPVSDIPVLEGNVLGVPHASHKTCWSYKADLPLEVKKAGKYKLHAAYKQNGAYKDSESTLTVNFTTEEAKIETVTTVTVSGGVKKAAKLLKSLADVAGVSVQEEGGQVKIVTDPNSADEAITLVPKSLIKGRSETCDSQNLPVMHFIVKKVLNNGDVEDVYNNPTHPNCEKLILSVSQLGDLSRINRLEATAILPDDPSSNYKSSQGDLVILVEDNKIKMNPFVKLSSDPAAENIASGEEKVTVTASTNYVVDDPVFKLTHNGEKSSAPATSRNNYCENGSGICQYSFDIFAPEGEYTIIFVNKGVEDTLSLNTAYANKEAIASVGLLVGNEEIPLDFSGRMIDLTLNSQMENQFFLVVRYTNGMVRRKNLTINYDQSANEPSPIPTFSFQATDNYYWYCDGSAIIEVDPAGNKRRHTECNQYGQQCRLISTQGYQSDAECYQGNSSVSAPTPIVTPTATPNSSTGNYYWFCRENTIIEVQPDRVERLHTDCSRFGQSCRPINTPGYQSDAECYGSSQPVNQQSESAEQTPQDSNNEGAAGQAPDGAGAGDACIYSEGDKCFDGTIRSQSSCPAKTTSNVCINPSGGCDYGGHQVDCATGAIIQ